MRHLWMALEKSGHEILHRREKERALFSDTRKMLSSPKVES